jgi:hypothetical protein
MNLKRKYSDMIQDDDQHVGDDQDDGHDQYDDHDQNDHRCFDIITILLLVKLLFTIFLLMILIENESIYDQYKNQIVIFKNKLAIYDYQNLTNLQCYTNDYWSIVVKQYYNLIVTGTEYMLSFVNIINQLYIQFMDIIVCYN